METRRDRLSATRADLSPLPVDFAYHTDDQDDS